jgi:hypothetical protein
VTPDPEIIRIFGDESPGIIRITEAGPAVQVGTREEIFLSTGGSGVEKAVAYTHRQGTTQDTWRITHGLGFYPNITAFDSSGDVIEGEIVHLDAMRATLIFSVALSGEAHCS